MSSELAAAVAALQEVVTNDTDEEDLHPDFHNGLADLAALLQTLLRQRAIDAYDFGARGDAAAFVDAATMSNGGSLLTVVGASFTSADIGKLVYVQGAGAAGAMLATTILGIASATSVALAASASATVTGATVWYGTDNTTPLQDWYAELVATGSPGSIGPGHFFTGQQAQAQPVKWRGAGIRQTVFWPKPSTNAVFYLGIGDGTHTTRSRSLGGFEIDGSWGGWSDTGATNYDYTGSGGATTNYGILTRDLDIYGTLVDVEIHHLAGTPGAGIQNADRNQSWHIDRIDCHHNTLGLRWQKRGQDTSFGFIHTWFNTTKGSHFGDQSQAMAGITVLALQAECDTADETGQIGVYLENCTIEFGRIYNECHHPDARALKIPAGNAVKFVIHAFDLAGSDMGQGKPKYPIEIPADGTTKVDGEIGVGWKLSVSSWHTDGAGTTANGIVFDSAGAPLRTTPHSGKNVLVRGSNATGANPALEVLGQLVSFAAGKFSSTLEVDGLLTLLAGLTVSGGPVSLAAAASLSTPDAVTIGAGGSTINSVLTTTTIPGTVVGGGGSQTVAVANAAHLNTGSVTITGGGTSETVALAAVDAVNNTVTAPFSQARTAGATISQVHDLRLMGIGGGGVSVGRDGTPDWFLSASNGAWLAQTDNAKDIGGAAANRPRDVNVGRNAVIGGALDHDGSTAGFYGTAPAAKPTVSGSRSDNTALASLLSGLATLGLITNSSTA